MKKRMSWIVAVTVTAMAVLLPGLARGEILLPPMPVRERELDLFVREIGGGTAGSGAVRILRYGSRGSLERPGSLDIPGRGRAFVLHSYDLLAPQGRAVEVRRLPGYRGWLEFEPGSFALALGEDRFELLYGSAVWRTGDEDTAALSLSAGPIRLRGRGEIRLERSLTTGNELVLEAVRGRFEITRAGALTAVLAPGQTRRILLTPEEGFDHALLERAWGELEHRLHDATLRLLEGPLSGEMVTTLWEAVLVVAPMYAHGEVQGVPDIPHPDLLLRAIGDALRLIGAFSLTPLP